MAEIALGGIEVAVVNRRRGPTGECPHLETLSTITAGLERLVCEGCGHLSVRYQAPLSGPVDRDRFARPADTYQGLWHTDAETGTAGPEGQPVTDEPSPESRWLAEVFARDERFHIRSRYESHPQPSAVLV